MMPVRVKKIRFPMFLKFLVACLLLAGLLIFGGTMLVKKESTFRNRGNWLAKHWRRYDFYQERTGRDMTGCMQSSHLRAHANSVGGQRKVLRPACARP